MTGSSDGLTRRDLRASADVPGRAPGHDGRQARRIAEGRRQHGGVGARHYEIFDRATAAHGGVRPLRQERIYLGRFASIAATGALGGLRPTQGRP